VAVPAWWPVATRRPVPNTASPHPGEGGFLYEVAGPFTETPLGWALHVVVGNGSPFETFRRAVSPKRKFSHVWIAKDGDVEQYGPFTHKSWANGTGNGLYYSAETEGFPEEPLTTAQIHRLAELHIFLGTADRVAANVSDKGIVCHYQGGVPWGGHSCPDPAPGGQGPRSHQRAAILAEVARLRHPVDPINGPLKLGSHGPDVTRVQRRLNLMGTGPDLAVDGAYGVKTQQQVVLWQGHHFLLRDGIVGHDTAKSLGFTYQTGGAQ
jgi:hypothetical protein